MKFLLWPTLLSVVLLAAWAAPGVDAPPIILQAGQPFQLGAYSNGIWLLDRDADRAVEPDTEMFAWGSPGNVAVPGDWNGDGFDNLAVSTGGTWFIDYNGDGIFDPATEIRGWGVDGWTPAPGDWNGDGVLNLGVVAPDSTWFRDLNGDGIFDPATEILGWGSPGDIPVVGDWNGDGRDQVAVYSGGLWFIDLNGDGQFDPATEMKGWGVAGWKPIVGDWNGDGKTKLGVVAPDSIWFRDLNGDFLFDPATEVLGWGSPGDIPVIGDWNGDGKDDPGVFSKGVWFVDFNGNGTWEPDEIAFGFGQAGDQPVVGRWAGGPVQGQVLVDPPSGSTGIARNRSIILTLPGPVDPATVTEQTVRIEPSGGAGVLIRRVSDDGRHIMVGGAFVGRANEQLELVAEGLRSATGGVIRGLRASLQADDQTNFDQIWGGFGAQGRVPTNAVVYARYTDRIDPTSFRPAEWKLIREADGREFAVECELLPSWLDIICRPEEPLGVGARYRVSGPNLENLYSRSSQVSIAFEAGFAEDLTPPQVLGKSPADGSISHSHFAPLTVVFDEPVVYSLGARVEVTRVGVGPVPVQVSPATDGTNSLEIRRADHTHGQWEPGPYTAIVEGIRNLAGLPMEGRVDFSFSVGAESAPHTGRGHSPASDERDVPVNTTVALHLQGSPVIPGTASTETFMLRGPSGRVPGQVRVEANSYRVVFDPLEDLAPHTWYTAESTTGLMSESGARLADSWRFMTGSGSDVTPPAVEFSWPPDGSVHQPTRLRPSVLLTEEFAPGSVNAQTVRLTAENGVVPNVAPSAFGRSISIAPQFHDPLQPNTVYIFEIDGVTDRAGKPLPRFVSHFRTGTALDAPRPTLTGMTPAIGSTGVSLQPTIELTFDAPLNPATVTPQSTGIANAPAAVTSFNDGLGIRITPLVPLLPNTQYTVNIGATNPSGQSPQLPGTPVFTTGDGPPDVTPPQVSEITIQEGESVFLVGGSHRFEILFSEPVQPQTVNADSILFLVNGRAGRLSPLSHTPDNRRFVFELVHNDLLQWGGYSDASELYAEVIVIDKVLDLAGNGLSPIYRRGFWAEGMRSTGSYPQLSVRQYRPGSAQVSPTVPITYLLSRRFVANDLSQTLYVAENGRLVHGQTEVIAEGRALRFTPDQPWADGALIQSFFRPELFGAGDGAPLSNPMMERSFRVADPSHPGPPQVEAFAPSCCGSAPANAVWMARLSEPVDPSTVTASSVILKRWNDNEGVPISVHLLNGDTIQAIPNQPLDLSGGHHLVLTSLITDLDGNSLAHTEGHFVALNEPADLTAPVLEAVSPPHGATDVPLNAPIRVRLSEQVNEAALRPGSLSASCGGSVLAMRPIEVSMSATPGRILVSVPQELFPAGATCTVSISGLTDRSGNPAPPLQWTFQSGTTISTDSPAEPIFSPMGSAVGLNAAVRLLFEEPLDPTSVVDELFAMWSGNPSVEIPLSVEVSADGRAISFIPQTNLFAGEEHRLQYNGDLRNLAGDRFSFHSRSFRVGFEPDTEPPFVLRTSIADGSANQDPHLSLIVDLTESLAANGLPDGSVQLLEDGVPVPISVTMDSARASFAVHALSLLDLGRTYSLRIVGLVDEAGNVMTAPFELTFSTRPSFDTTRPTTQTNMFSVGPGEHLHRTVSAKVRFSKPMDPATIRPDTVYFALQNGEPLPSQPILDASGTFLALHPAAPLPANSFIAVVVDQSQVADPSGNLATYSSTPLGSFWTGAALTDTEPPVLEWPTILSSSPIPISFPWRMLRDLANEPLDPWSFEGDLVEMRNASGELVQPWTNLAQGASYTLTVNEATDFAGNPLIRPEPFLFSPSGVDAIAPDLVGHSPASGATGVPVDSVITVDFTEPVWFGGLLFHRRTGNDHAEPFTYTMSESGRLTIYPSEPMWPNTRYSVSFRAFDIGNNELACCPIGAGFSFTTGHPLIVDDEAPTLLAINPPDGATAVTDRDVTLTFSEPVNLNTIGQSIGYFLDGEPIQFNTSLTADGATLRLMPLSSMPVSGAVSIAITEALTDLSNNPAVPVVSRFGYVSPHPAAEPELRVISERPRGGSTDVAQDAAIHLFLSRAADPSSVASALRVTENGVVIGGDIDVHSEDRVVTFRPHSPFVGGARVRVFVDYRLLRTPSGALAGNWTYESNFQTKGGPANPTVQMRFSPPDYSPVNSLIMVDFDRPMDPSTFTPDAILLRRTNVFNSSLDLTYSLENSGTRLRVIPDAPLPPGAPLALRLSSSIRALDGASVSGHSFTELNFLVGNDELAAPALLTGMSPADGETGVGVNATIELVFNTRVNRLTLNTKTVRWTNGGGEGVPHLIETSDHDGRSWVKVVPHDPFTPLGTYNITIEGVEDLAGRVIPTRTASFSAADGPDFEAPLFVSASPEGEGAPLNAVPTIVFDEPLSAASVNESTVRLVRAAVTGSPELGKDATVLLSSDGRIIYVTPTEPLEPHTLYRVEVTNRVRDVSGNATYRSFAFTTGADFDLTPPQLLYSLPVDGATDVPINHRLLLVFDSAIRPESVTELVRIEAAGQPAPVETIVAGPMIELKPTELLDPLTPYQWIAEGLTDLAGNVIPAPLSGAFSTGAGARLTTPVIESTAPEAGSSGVSTTASIELRFNNVLNPRSISPSAFLLWDQTTGGQIPFTVSHSEDLKTIKLTPTEPLPANRGIVVDLRHGLIDVYGLRPDYPVGFTFSFTTGN